MDSKSMVWIGVAMVEFRFGNIEQVTGFHIGDSRVKGIWFEKVLGY